VRAYEETGGFQMPNIEIAFLACSLLLGRCEDVTLKFHSSNGIVAFECMRYGQWQIVQWQRAHPNWSVSRGYKCRPARQVAQT